MLGSSQKSQQGVALIQTLLIMLIISLLALQFTYTARGQVTQSQLLQQRLDSELLTYSLKQQALFAQLTNQRVVHQPEDVMLTNILKASSGFNTTAFVIDNEHNYAGWQVMVSTSDVSALLPLHYPKHPLWPDYLVSKGWELSEIDEFLTYLTDVQDTDLTTVGGGSEPALTSQGLPYINQSFRDRFQVKQYLQAYPEILDMLNIEVRYQYDYDVALAQAPSGVLNSIIAPSIVSELVSQRAEGQSIRRSLRELLNQSNRFSSGEGISYSPSTVRRINISVAKDDVLLRTAYDVRLSALNTPPYYLLNKQYQ